MLESKNQVTQQKTRPWGPAQWEGSHGENLAIAVDASQGTKRKEKLSGSLFFLLSHICEYQNVRRGVNPWNGIWRRTRATNGSEGKWAKDSTIGKLKDVPQDSMLCDNIITRYGISDKSTEY